MTVGVFISYNHQDVSIANALAQALFAISPDISVFIDHSGLEAGDEYELRIARSISQSQWFLIICSGSPRPERDMGWCLYEAGQFRQKLTSESSESLIRDRLVALHDDKRPAQIQQFQSTLVNEIDRQSRPLDLRPSVEDNSQFEYTDVYGLLVTIVKRSQLCPLRDLVPRHSDFDRLRMLRLQRG
jgi:hypothetical protein